MNNSKLRIGILILVILLVIMAYGTAIALYELTLVTWWIPWGLCALFALVSGLTMWRLWRGLTGESGFTLNYLAHVGAATGIAAALFFGINYLGADTAESHEETVTVERKYRKEHHRTRRVGRRYVRETGNPWYDYHIDVRLENGQEKSLTVPVRRYSRLRTGSSITITLSPGLLGLPVIKRDEAPSKNG